MDELQQMVTRARHWEAAKQFEAARQEWLRALQLLPPGTGEYQGVLQEVRRLEAKMTPQSSQQWTKRLGPLGVIAAFLYKFKVFIFFLLGKGGFFFNILGFLVFYWALYGWWFGVGLFFSILIHEFGHYITARRMGFAADLPRFHLFGAYVRWGGVGIDVDRAAMVALAGPLFGFGAGLIAYGVYIQTGRGVWLGVAQFTAWLNLLNLIPIWIFDGSRAMSAIGKAERVAIAAVGFVLAFLLHSWLPAFVGGATVFRIMSRDFPSQPRQRIAYAYIALVLATGFLNWFCIQQRSLKFGDEERSRMGGEQHQISFQKSSASERLT